MDERIPTRNVQRSITFNRFLYVALREEADKDGIKIAHVINQKLSKLFEERIELLKLQEKMKYR